MNIAFAYIISAVLGYLLGGINGGIIITKLVAHKDIRTLGSGNAGSTNVLRVLGLKPALITLSFDFLKSVIAVALAILVFKLLCPQISDLLGKCVAALFAVLGHMYPAYFGFKGGKGVITLAGGLLFIHPVYLLVAIALFALTVALTKYVSLGSLVSTVGYLFMLALIPLIGRAWSQELLLELAISALAVFMVVFKHRSNIGRLLKGNERKISFKKPTPPEEQS